MSSQAMDSSSEIPSEQSLRRSARMTAKARATAEAPLPPDQSNAPPQRKRKAADKKTSADKLEYLLTNTRSKLTKIDMSDVINYQNFLDLSEESQQKLCKLLPPTSFYGYQPIISPTHPDSAIASQHASSSATRDDITMQDCTPATLDPSTFKSPFFLSAAGTFQDHLYSGWLGSKALETARKFEQGVRDGTMHADWKDEVWESENQRLSDARLGKKLKPRDLATLAKSGLLKEGDILSYRRKFDHLGIVVEKDALIQTIDGRDHNLTVLFSRTAELHWSLLVRGPLDPEEHTQAIENLVDPEVLEHALLNSDGRTTRSERERDASSGAGSSASWKKFTVWRWRDEMMQSGEGSDSSESKGGRGPLGTLFYLKGYCHK